MRVPLLILGGCLLAVPVLAQTGPRILDRDRSEAQDPAPRRDAAVPPSGGATAAPPSIPSFTLREVRVLGATQVPPDALAATWADRRGRTISAPDLVAITEAIGGAYRDRDIALFTVLLPVQDFAGGTVVVRVVEGTLGDVRIEGETDGEDLALLRGYVERMLAERPLTRAALERYILLIGDIPGLTVGSAFEAMEGAAPGATRLRLAVARKRFEFGSGVNNLGAVPLGRLQFDVNATANGLLQQGDRTQLIYGFPADFQRYQYFGANHTLPIGTDGTTLRIAAGYLRTHRSDTTLDGTAWTTGLLLSHPIRRSARENLYVTAGFDTLDSNSAFLGFTASDERTRALRLGAIYQLQDGWDGVNSLAVTASLGLDALGARQRSFAGGDPAFTKATLRAGREQPLPRDFVLRATLSAQIAGENLPPSEKFLYGGADLGRAFGSATLNGDRGVSGGLELAYRIPASLTAGIADGSEVYGFVDAARTWNQDRRFYGPRDRAATGGFGVRARVREAVQLQLEAATAIERPRFAPTRDETWRIVFSVRSLL